MVSIENQIIQVHHDPKEKLEGRIYHNRRILRDGQTVSPTELKNAFHNGVNYYCGITKHNSRYEAEAISHIRFPLTRESGYRDPLLLGHGLTMRDFQFSQLFHNGSIMRRVRAKHNAEFMHNADTNRMPIARHNGRSPYSVSDAILRFLFKQPTIENFTSTENYLLNLTVYDREYFRRPNFHDGKQLHNSEIFYSGKVIDLLSFLQSISLKDKAAGATYHNGILPYDENECHSGLGNTFAYDKLYINFGVTVTENIATVESQILQIENDTSELVSKLYKRNSTYTHNGSIIRTSLLNDKFKMHTAISPILIDNAEGTLYHNNIIKYNGIERHSSAGTKSAYETLAMGIRYHHFRNGVYFRNNEIKHNAGVFIPLEDIA